MCKWERRGIERSVEGIGGGNDVKVCGGWGGRQGNW